MKRSLIIIAFWAMSGFCLGQQISRTEYFIGEDPGFGRATPIVISASEEELSLDFITDIQTLSEGFHFINIRACNELRQWGHPAQRLFYVFKVEGDADNEITTLECFIDTDPGFGLANPITLSSTDNNIAINFSASLNALSEGVHFINIRARNKLGKWGHPAQRVFYVFRPQPNADVEITGIEYFIDTDPGFGMGTAVNLATIDKDITVNFVVNVAGLIDGDHILYVRSKDALNRWGHMYSQGFTSIYTSIHETKIESLFKLYPNPSNGNFYLEFSKEPYSPIKIFIDDLNGKRVYAKELNPRVNLLNLNLPTGMYLLNVEQEGKSFSHKIIIH
jgi:hypothetical protein